jgi:diacylglycerol kinase
MDYLKARLNSIRHAWEGISQVIITQQNARIHTGFTLVVLVMGIILGINRIEWISLVFVVGLVWTAELMNTAIELIIDLVSPEHQPVAKSCKDVSAGAVLASVITSIIVGILIFGPPLWRWIMGFLY